MTQSAPQRRYGAIVLAGIVLATLTLSCPSEQESAVRKSKVVFDNTMQSEPHFAAYALEVAAASNAPYARGVIVSLLGSDDYGTAREAVNAIVENPPQEATEALRGVFATKTGLLKLNSAIALARLGDAEALQFVRDEVLQEGGALTLPAVTMLVERGEADELQPILAQRMKNDEPTVRDETYVLLGEIQQPWATALLVEGLKGEFAERRQQAIISLGRTRDPAVAEEILPFINTKGLVFDALQALGALGSPEAVDSLEAMMQHENPLVQLYAAVALWRVGEESAALAHLEPLVNDPDPTLRLNLAEQLANVESPRAAQMLAQLTAAEDHDIRLAAFQSLAQLSPADQIDLFVTASEDSDYTLAAVALDTLARIGTEAEVTKIAPQLDSTNKYVAVSAANAILSITGA
jgi:HEAT repeat protein